MFSDRPQLAWRLPARPLPPALACLLGKAWGPATCVSAEVDPERKLTADGEGL